MELQKHLFTYRIPTSELPKTIKGTFDILKNVEMHIKHPLYYFNTFSNMTNFSRTSIRSPYPTLLNMCGGLFYIFQVVFGACGNWLKLLVVGCLR